MNKQLRLAGLVIVLGFVLGFGYWQRQSSAAEDAGNKLEQPGNDLKARFSPTSASKAFRSTSSPAPASAMATISVTSLADGPATAENCPGLNCRLRDAIATAADGDTIDFSVTGTIVLNSGELAIVKNLTIQGPGAAQLTISGNQVSRVFYIGGVTVALNDLTVTKGFVSGNYGGNIFNAGTLTTTNCTISDGYGELHGGGFWNQGTLTLNGCTISGNSSTDGGGMFNLGVVTIANTTISGNYSTYTGGGIRTGGGVLTLINCTISGNQGSFAGGVSNPGPEYPVFVRNTIISGNIDRNGWGLPDVTGWETNLGNNLIGGSALLAPLGNYGGAIQTHALLPGSPAINAGDNCVLTNTCADNNLGFNLTTDQRGSGFNRQAIGTVDIGAFESRGFTLAINGGDNQSTNTNTDFANPLAVTVVANGSGEPVAGGQVTFQLPPSGASATITGNPATVDNGGAATSGTVMANATAGSYAVLAGGAGLNSVSFSLTNTGACSTITISPAGGALPAGTVGAGYSQQFAQSGGSGMISWSVSSTVPGLSISATGLLSGTPTTAGSYKFTVTATDANGCSGFTNYSLTIGIANQTITFKPISNKTFGDPAFLISPVSSAGLAVNVEVISGPCTLSSSLAPADVQINGAGSCTITASQAGDSNYNAAPSVSQIFTIAKAAATLTLSNLNQIYNGSPRSVTVTTSPANLSGVSVTYNNSTTAPTNAGSYAVAASLNNANYLAPNVTGTLVIAKASQTITFTPLAKKTYGDAPFKVNATASSGLAVSLAASGNCTISLSTVTLTGAGSCSITASQAGNTNYNAAPNVTQSFSIAKANQTITFGPLPNKTLGDATFKVNATASSGLAVSFTASGSCTVSGNIVKLTSVGSCTITASQAGDANYNAAPPVSQSFNIAPNCPAISLFPTTLPAGVYGVPYSVRVIADKRGVPPYKFTVSGLPSGLKATAGSLDVTISGTPLQAGVFTVQIIVEDSTGCTNTAGNVFPLTIAKGTPTILWNNPASIYCNTPLGPAQLNAIAIGIAGDKRPLPGSFVYTPPAGTVLGYGTHKLTVLFTPADTANWNPAPKSVNINVVRKSYLTLNPDGYLNTNDGQLYTLTMDRIVAGVTDGCAELDKNSVVVITSVTSDEPDDIPGYSPDGSTRNDIVISPDCKSVQLRAERDSTLDGRVYKVNVRVIGNSAAAGQTAVFTVKVPVRQNTDAIDSGVARTVRSNCW